MVTDSPGPHLPSQDLHLWFFEFGFRDLQEIRLPLHLIKELMRDFSVQGCSLRSVVYGYLPIVHVVSKIFQVSLEQFSEVAMHHPLKEG